MLKDMEKEKLDGHMKSTLTTDSVQKLATVFVDGNDFASDGKKVVDKMTIMLNKHKRLHEATTGRVQFCNTYFFSWKWMRTNVKFKMENVDIELKVSTTSMTQLLVKEAVRTLGLMCSSS